MTREEAGHTFDVLTQHPDGPRRVHRVHGADREAAERGVADTLDQGETVIGSTMVGIGPTLS